MLQCATLAWHSSCYPKYYYLIISVYPCTDSTMKQVLSTMMPPVLDVAFMKDPRDNSGLPSFPAIRCKCPHILKSVSLLFSSHNKNISRHLRLRPGVSHPPSGSCHLCGRYVRVPFPLSFCTLSPNRPPCQGVGISSYASSARLKRTCVYSVILACNSCRLIR